MRYVQQCYAPPVAGIPDSVLLAQASAGDERTFEALVGRYYGPLLRFIRSCLDELRTRQRRRVVYFSELECKSGDEEVPPLEFIPDPQPLPEEIAERFDLHCMLQRAMLTLPPKSRSIVQLRCSRELSFSEIGGMLEMSVPTVKAYFYRSLPRLRTVLMAETHV
jgi:RNA polymerase sigma factor (sigma-70 family)